MPRYRRVDRSKRKEKILIDCCGKDGLGACEQEVFCFFESSDGRLTRDGRKSLQKVFECFSALQVVEQRLDGHAGSAKHRSSAQNVRIFDDNSHGMIVSRAIVAGAWGEEQWVVVSFGGAGGK